MQHTHYARHVHACQTYGNVALGLFGLVLRRSSLPEPLHLQKVCDGGEAEEAGSERREGNKRERERVRERERERESERELR